MSRTKLFTQAFFIMFRRGAAVMWVAAAAASAVEILFDQIIVLGGLAGSLVGLLRGALIGAFVAGVLITAVNSQSDGQPLSIAGGMRAGVRPYVPLLLVGLILAVPGWIMGQVMSALLGPISLINPANLNSLSSSPSLLLCCLAPFVLLAYLAVSLLLYAVGVGAERGVALEGLGVSAALKRGWMLLRSKFSEILVIGLIILAISIGLIILIGCPASLLIVIASGAAQTPAGITAAASPYTDLLTILFGVINIPLGIFFSAVWTLAFRRWQGKEELAPVTFLTPPVDLPPIGG